MTTLIGLMLRVRRFQAILVTIIATIAIGTAVALPAFLATADREIIAADIAHAPPRDHLIEASRRFSGGSVDDAPDGQFAQDMPDSLAVPGFAYTYGVSTDVTIDAPTITTPMLQFRQDECAHIVMVSGRCPVGNAEAVVDAALAKEASLRIGGTAVVHFKTLDPRTPVPDEAFKPYTLTIVGIYKPADPAEPYWGVDPPFGPDLNRDADAPVLTSAATMQTFVHRIQTETADAYVIPSAIAPDDLAAIRAAVRKAVGTASAVDVNATSQVPLLLDEIDQDRSAIRQLVPIIALPLIVLGGLVVYLAAGYAIAGRREELGVLALRGLPWVQRWWLGAGEVLLALAAAVPLGYLAGSGSVWAAARYLLPGDPAVPPLGYGSARYAGLTVAGCVVAILFAARRTLATPTSDLLRDVPARSARWRAVTLEIVIVALAVVAVMSMRGQDGALSGVDLLAPGLAIGAFAVVAARLLIPLATLTGSRGLRRGGARRLGFSIGALQVARRPGVARLFAIIVIAVGLVTYAAASARTGRELRAYRTGVVLGGSKVVTVASTTRFALLGAVGKADPSGRYAMAATTIARRAPTDPPILAVDSSRLAAVATWPDGPVTARRAEALLSPGTGTPMTFTGSLLSLRMSFQANGAHGMAPQVAVFVQPMDGSPTEEAFFSRADGTIADPAPSGTAEYTTDIGPCGAGCRVAALSVFDTNYTIGDATVTIDHVTVRHISDQGVIGAPQPFPAFGTAASWRPVADIETDRAPAVTSAAGRLTIGGSAGIMGFTGTLGATDNVYPVPALTTVKLVKRDDGIVGNDRRPVSVAQAALVPELPGMPDGGLLVDITDIDRALPAVAENALAPQVWLAANAPADMVQRLRNAGLIVTNVSTLADARARLDDGGPAIGTRFAKLAVLGLLLLAVGAIVLSAAVDRRRRGTELRALRIQGLSFRKVSSAVAVANISVAVLALIAGPAAGLVSWWLTGAKVPVFADPRLGKTPLTWPEPSALVRTWLDIAVVLLAVTVIAGWDLRRYVRSGAPRPARFTGPARSRPSATVAAQRPAEAAQRPAEGHDAGTQDPVKVSTGEGSR